MSKAFERLAIYWRREPDPKVWWEHWEHRANDTDGTYEGCLICALVAQREAHR